MFSVFSTQNIAITVVLLVAAVSGIDNARAQIYKYKDKDGNVVFSDTRPANTEQAAVEEVELGATNSSGPPPEVPKAATKVDSDTKTIAYESVITSPSDGSTIPMGPGNFAVTANFSPALVSGERVQLLLDGAVVGEPQRGSAWQLSNVYRGEHQLVVQRIDRGGRTLHSSSPVTVYVLRPSIR